MMAIVLFALSIVSLSAALFVPDKNIIGAILMAIYIVIAAIFVNLELK